ncbi:hydroxymethylglutaryl-CoA lyase [Parageobacillus thermoglucosidasius]|uniref:Hydroxymethylglutaryl-CoA lyase n=1 Tax=Parageobacillus thermoglucosidasius TaxID=1426 RepID=A0A1B7KVE5_PARTM|nr:hydroxymethylglutaryl-CoA lyase [Parageobacillus thermoglucosidasius]OAT74069.1 hydroxymethylglutaryl-CoA lyase [Parageobacillus thermoglucosidasius]
MIFPKTVEIIEVGPRDGLQNEPLFIPTEQKKELIAKLTKVGFKRIETTAFVHPKWVPQMADAEEIAAFCKGLNYIALTPNMKALERAIQANVPQIAVFIGASSAFNKKNINKTTDESLRECEAIFEKAKDNGMLIRAYVSMAFSCPYQGEVTFEEVHHVCQRFVELGADEIDIGDTNGHANPKIVYERFARLRDLYPDMTFVGHFHDTRKMALANVIAAMQAGVDKFDSSVGGLGGCPYSPGATGNVATEDLVLMLSEMGIETGVDLDSLKEVAEFAKSLSTR